MALTSSDYEGRTYRLSGPDSPLPADRVRVLGEVLGRKLRFEGQSDVEARDEMLASMPAEYMDAFFSFFADRKLDESEVRYTVERVTGGSKPGRRARSGTRRTPAFLSRNASGLASCATRSARSESFRTVLVRGRRIDS
jgi:hypothetical protein